MDSIKQCDKSYHFPDILILVSNPLLLGLLARYQWPNMLTSYNLPKSIMRQERLNGLALHAL